MLKSYLFKVALKFNMHTIFVAVDKRDSKAALSQHQETTGHVVHTPPLIDHIRIIEKEPRDLHRKVLEAINIKLKGARLNRTDGVELPDVYLPLLKEEGGREGGPVTKCTPLSLLTFRSTASFP